MKDSPYPNFIGIGAQKSGTTWLSHNLRMHPQVWIPSIKEVHYFDDRIKDPQNTASRLSSKLFGREILDRRWRRMARDQARRHLRGLSGRELLWDLRYFFGTPDDEWYASLFEAGGGRVIGEVTPAYSMLEPDDIAHVHELMPRAKIIFLMRNPMERAWSRAARLFDRASSPNDPDSVKDRRLRRHFDSERSRLRTGYLRTLENWGAFYPEERIFVGFLEDINFFPGELLRNLYSFLGVDPSFSPQGMGQRVHSRSVGRVPTKPMVYLARSYHEEIIDLSERFGGYASFWLYCAERLIEDPPEDTSIPYPLWESALWEEWTSAPGSGRRPQPQSGPLASVQVI